MLMLYEQYQGVTVEMGRKWTDEELRDFIMKYSAWLFDGYEVRHSANQRMKPDTRNKLEPVSVVTHTVRAVIAVSVCFTILVCYQK
jgi:hypothetical protein